MASEGLRLPETARELNGVRRNGGPTISQHPPTYAVFDCPSCPFSGCETAVLSHGVRAHGLRWDWDAPRSEPEPRNGSSRELRTDYGFYRERLRNGDKWVHAPRWARERFGEEAFRRVVPSLDPQRLVRPEELARNHGITRQRAVLILKAVGYRRWGSPGTPWLPGPDTPARLASLGEPVSPVLAASSLIAQPAARAAA